MQADDEDDDDDEDDEEIEKHFDLPPSWTQPIHISSQGHASHSLSHSMMLFSSILIVTHLCACLSLLPCTICVQHFSTISFYHHFSLNVGPPGTYLKWM